MTKSDAKWRALAIVAGAFALFGLYLVARGVSEFYFQHGGTGNNAPTPADIRAGMSAAGRRMAGGLTVISIGGLLFFVGLLGVRRHAQRERLRQQDEEPWR